MKGINRGGLWWNRRRCRRLGHDNRLLADGTVDLLSAISGVAQNVLAALGAKEFIFSHRFLKPQNESAWLFEFGYETMTLFLCRVNLLNFLSRKRAVKDGRFVNQSVEAI